MGITRKSILQDRLDMARHNLRCYSRYSAGSLEEIPKDGYKTEFAEAKKEVAIIEEWLAEFQE